jgi:hypothetical protein
MGVRMDIKTLEQHHNALQIMFNLLINTLLEESPEVVKGWLQSLDQVLETEPSIVGRQRDVMTRMLKNVTEVLEEKESPRH